MAFDTLLVADRDANDDGNIDFGRLVEDMLFYRTVQLVVGRRQLAGLIARVGPHNLVDLVSRGSLKLVYTNNVVGAKTSSVGVIDFLDPVLVTTSKLQLDPTAYELFADAVPDGSVAIELADRLIRACDDQPHLPTACDAARRTLRDADGLAPTIRLLLRELGLSEVTNLRFIPTWHDDQVRGFTVDTNIPFNAINERGDGPLRPLNAARLVAGITAARSTLDMAAKRAADVDTDPVHAVLLSHYLRKAAVAGSPIKPLDLFKMLVVPGNAVAEAVNTGSRSFDDVLRLLDDAERFRGWLSEQPADKGLIENYYREATSSGWVSKQPAKTFRWLLTVAAGLVLPGAGGIVVDALDEFLVERLVQGWRPQQFVDGPLRSFVDD